MKKIIALLSVIGTVFAASADDLYLWWMVDTSTATGGAGNYTYDTVKIKATDNDPWGASAGGTYLTMYSEDLTKSASALSADNTAMTGRSLYAALGAYTGTGYSYVVELYNDNNFLSQSVLSYSNAGSYIATVTASGIITPALSPAQFGGFAAPEPSSALLMAIGCAALALRRRTKNA